MKKRNMKERKKNGLTKRWVAKVKTDSTHPPAGLFTRSARTIANALASPKVSPKGPASGMRMLNYFINRAGKGLTAKRRAELQKAKALLSKRVERSRLSKTKKARH
jgi:tRNA(adenine34) deaminase